MEQIGSWITFIFSNEDLSEKIFNVHNIVTKFDLNMHIKYNKPIHRLEYISFNKKTSNIKSKEIICINIKKENTH